MKIIVDLLTALGIVVAVCGGVGLLLLVAVECLVRKDRR